MTLDLPAMQALWALAESDVTAAVRALDETGARADDVEDATLRPLWAALEERIRGRRSVDVVTLAECLRATGVLGEVRLERVSALGEYVPRGVEVERLRMLREAGARRQCLEAMRAAAVKLKAGAPLAEVEAELRLLPSLVAGVRPRVRSAKGDTLRIVDEAEAAWREGRSPTLRTGWEQLDACWRLIPNLHAVGAQGGVGKTALVAGLVRGWTHNSVTVGVLAYEDDGLELQRRILAAEAELELALVYGERLGTQDETERWQAAHVVRQEAERYLLLDDAHPRGTVGDVCASLRVMRARGAHVAILDNLSCVAMDAREERHQAIEDALLAVRETAVELRMPVLVVGHLKRSVTSADEATTEPRLSDFAGSAGWERYARSCLGMWRGNNGNPRLAVLKQNQGRVGDRFEAVLRPSAATVVDVVAAVDAEPTERRRYARE